MPLNDKEIGQLQDRLKIVDALMRDELSDNGTLNEVRNFISGLDRNTHADLDRNKNRKTDPTEIGAAFSRKNLDSDGDGQPDAKGVKSAILKLADHNQDGKLSKYEALMLVLSLDDPKVAKALDKALKSDKGIKLAYDQARVELLEEAFDIKHEAKGSVGGPRQTPSVSSADAPTNQR